MAACAASGSARGACGRTRSSRRRSDSMRRAVATDQAPKAIGPYSQAVITDGWVFCSGQIPLDPATGQTVEGDVAAQTRQVFSNLRHVLEAAGCGFEAVVKTTVFLADMNDFAAMNE